jgi:hypothetical protein
VGCGVFLDLLPPMTEEEKDKKARRQQMKTVMESEYYCIFESFL